MGTTNSLMRPAKIFSKKIRTVTPGALPHHIKIQENQPLKNAKSKTANKERRASLSYLTFLTRPHSHWTKTSSSLGRSSKILH